LRSFRPRADTPAHVDNTGGRSSGNRTSGGERQLRAQWPAGQRGGPADGRAAGSTRRAWTAMMRHRAGPCRRRRWRFRRVHFGAEGIDRERSTTSCQADVCEACGMLRLTSFRTG